MSLKPFTPLTRRQHKEAIIKCIQAFVDQNSGTGRSPRLYDPTTLTDPQLLDLERQQFNRLPGTLPLTPPQPAKYAPPWYLDLRWALGNLYAGYGYGADDGLRKTYTNDHIFQWWMVDVRKGRPPTQEGFPMTFEDFITLLHATADEDEQTQTGIGVSGWVDPATLNVVEVYIQYVVEYANTIRAQGTLLSSDLPVLTVPSPSNPPVTSNLTTEPNTLALQSSQIVVLEGSSNPLKRPLSPVSRLDCQDENHAIYHS